MTTKTQYKARELDKRERMEARRIARARKATTQAITDRAYSAILKGGK